MRARPHRPCVLGAAAALALLAAGCQRSAAPGCPAGQVQCAGGCVDLTADAHHCGACGTTCLGASVCFEGACAALPAVTSFTASATSVASGADVTLSWSTTDAQHAIVAPGPGQVDGGSVVVNPAATTVYTLTAWNAVGTATATVRVAVTDAPACAGDACDLGRASCTGLAFDGARMWVGRGNARTVLGIRAADGETVGPFETGASVAGLALVDGELLAAHQGESSLTRLHPAGGIVWLSTAVGASPVEVLAAGGLLWTDSSDAEVTRLSPLDGNWVGTTSLPAPTGGLAADATGLWTSGTIGGTLGRIRLADGALVAEYGLGGRPSRLAFDGAHLVVLDEAGSLVLVNPEDGTEAARHPLPAGLGTPFALALDGAAAWVAAGEPATVVRIALADGAVLATHGPFGQVGRWMAWDGARLWVTTVETSAAGVFRCVVRKLTPGAGP